MFKLSSDGVDSLSIRKVVVQSARSLISRIWDFKVVKFWYFWDSWKKYLATLISGKVMLGFSPSSLPCVLYLRLQPLSAKPSLDGLLGKSMCPPRKPVRRRYRTWHAALDKMSPNFPEIHRQLGTFPAPGRSNSALPVNRLRRIHPRRLEFFGKSVPVRGPATTRCTPCHNFGSWSRKTLTRRRISPQNRAKKRLGKALRRRSLCTRFLMSHLVRLWCNNLVNVWSLIRRSAGQMHPPLLPA